MRVSPTKRLCSQKVGDAFSLVEVVIALGLLTFCVIALMGLFSVGLRTGRQSAEDTVLSALAFQLVSEMTASESNLFPVSDSVIRYYDSGGTQVSQANSLYRCELRKISNSTDLAGMPNSLVRVRITFSWPEPRHNNSNSFYVTLPPSQ